MAKLDLDITLIDGSVVRNGFRALMSGAQLDEFKANPVMLLQHNRPEGGYMKHATTDILLPIGKWYDIRVEGDRLLAKPEFDDDDELAVKIEGKVKKGYLNAASIWIDPITVSDDASLALPGQPGPTITKWGVLEASIVDIPNCRGALAIRNSAGNKVLLSGNGNDEGVLDYLNSFLKQDNIKDMDKKLLCAKLGLADTATDGDISQALLAMQQKANDLSSVQAENAQLKLAMATLKQEQLSTKITALVQGGIDSGRILAGDKEKYEKLAAADYETTAALINGLAAAPTIQGQLSAAAGASEVDKAELAELMKLSGHKLYLDGKLERLKLLSLESFKLKYKEAFSVDYKEPATK